MQETQSSCKCDWVVYNEFIIMNNVNRIPPSTVAPKTVMNSFMDSSPIKLNTYVIFVFFFYFV